MNRRRSALAVAGLAVVLASTFMSFRVSAVGFDGSVVAGRHFVEGSTLPIYPNYGYDGQFYYRMVISPFSTADRVDGVRFDQPAYRQQRIGFPLVALGVDRLSPLSAAQSMVLVNVIAVGALVYFGGRIAQHDGRSPLFGLVLLAWPAFIFSLGMNLADVLAAALLVGASYYAMTSRHTAASILFVGGVLTRETLVLAVVAALVVYRRYRYLIPIGILGAWQVGVWALWGEPSFVSAAADPEGDRVGLPLVGIINGIATWTIVDIAVFAALVTVVWIGVRGYSGRTFAVFTFGAYATLAVLLGTPVWQNWRGFSRATIELVCMAYILRSQSIAMTHQPAVGTVGTPAETAL